MYLQISFKPELQFIINFHASSMIPNSRDISECLCIHFVFHWRFIDMFAVTWKFSFLWPWLLLRPHTGESVPLLSIYLALFFLKTWFKHSPAKRLFIFWEGKVNRWMGSLLKNRSQRDSWSGSCLLSLCRFIRVCVCACVDARAPCSVGESIRRCVIHEAIWLISGVH